MLLPGIFCVNKPRSDSLVMPLKSNRSDIIMTDYRLSGCYTSFLVLIYKKQSQQPRQNYTFARDQ